MHAIDTSQRFETLDEKVPVGDYNYEHFHIRYFLRDGKRSLTNRGIRPGELAPDFVLPQVGGDSIRLSDLRGQPVLLHFGSRS